jgi:CHAT domain-containing protein
MTAQEAVAAMRELARRGAYAEAERFAQALPAEVKALPAVALQLARTALRQGQPANAERALAAAAVDGATPGEQLILGLERASLRIYRAAAIREAADLAKALLTAADMQALDAADAAEADRVFIRIVLSAATYFEVSREEATEAWARLPRIADVLENAGRPEESLVARVTYAERMDDPKARVEALARVAEHALRSGRQEIAAEARTLAAEQLLSMGAPRGDVAELLDSAQDLYAQANHQHGSIDVDRVRAKLAIERELSGLEALDACVQAYRRLELHRGVLTTLMDLSQLAHVRGDTAAAARYRSEALAASEQVGMVLSRDANRTAQVDLLMRAQRLQEARELCETALADDLPDWSRAAYEQLLGTVYSFMDDIPAACVHARRAIELFEAVGDTGSASNTVVKLASDLSSRRRDDAFDEAEALLRTWQRHDHVRGNAADGIAKREMLAQLNVLRFLYSPTRRGEVGLLTAANAILTEAESLTGQLQPAQGAHRRGNLEQMRAQVLQAQGDEDGVIDAWRRALAHFEPAGYALEAANCRYIIGVAYLNRANIELLPHFGVAEQHFREALAYYDAAGMRGQASDTRFMLARLYANAAPRVAPDLGGQMLDAALEHLDLAESNADAIRREFDAGQSAIEIQQAKRALVARTRRNAQLAVEILCRLRPDPAEAWRRVQRAKARALVDLLGMSAAPPSRVLAALAGQADALKLVAEERDLTIRLRELPAAERAALREELERLRAQMARDPRLSEYLELRTGTAVDESDLAAALAGTRCVCADWVAEGDRLFLLTLRPGQAPRIWPLPLRLQDVQRFVATHLAPQAFRVTLRDTPDALETLAALVAPLREVSEPDELLILAPTGPLHALPLHALPVDGDVLIARNPVVYTSSLTVLRHCLSRADHRKRPRSAALFGDPTGDRAEAAALVAHLEAACGTAALLGAQVTVASFLGGVADRDLVHFHGHAKHDPQEPLDSHLVLADGKLTARDVFELRGLRPDLMTLAACESASNVVEPGDEPLGLIPAFLYAGATSVLATLWKVHQASATRTMRHFYDSWLGQPAAHKAEVLRAAVLETRRTAKFESPYHWAPFVLHGNWH